MVTCTAIGGTLQYGYNLAIMNAPTTVRDTVFVSVFTNVACFISLSVLIHVKTFCCFCTSMVLRGPYSVSLCSTFRISSTRHFWNDGARSWSCMKSL